MELKGAVAVVTGASSGIGAETARLLAAEGAKVVLAARRADRLRALGKELPGSLAVPTDVRDPEAVRRLISTAAEHFGRIDILVNDAGQGLHVPVEQVKLADLQAVVELNVYGPIVAMQAVLPVMRRQGGGLIVNVSSGTTRMVLPGAGPYSATKAMLNMISEVARAELAGDGIRVMLVYPSVTATEFHQSLRAGVRAGGSGGGHIQPDSAERVARAIVDGIRSDAPEVVLTPTRTTT